MNATHTLRAAATIQPAPTKHADSTEHLDRFLAQFAPISLQDMEGVALLDRTDTKMLLTQDQLYMALYHLTDDYRVLEIEGRRRHHYQTLYFDTPDLDFYHQHHNGKRDRYKVRERMYMDSDLAFVEVKHKTDQNRTIKRRHAVPKMTTSFGTPAAAFLRAEAPVDDRALIPALQNDFERITLASTHSEERVTLDIGLRFHRDAGWLPLPGVVIAEVKQARFSYDSDFMREMRYLGVRPTSFSKYCTGISLLYPAVKHNAFKPRLLYLGRLMQANQHI